MDFNESHPVMIVNGMQIERIVLWDKNQSNYSTENGLFELFESIDEWYESLMMVVFARLES